MKDDKNNLREKQNHTSVVWRDDFTNADLKISDNTCNPNTKNKEQHEIPELILRNSE